MAEPIFENIPGIKRPKNFPEHQRQVEEEGVKLYKKYPAESKQSVYQMARDKVANSLRIGRIKRDLEKVKMFDNDTGLHSKLWYEDQLKEQLAEAKRQGKSIYVLRMDIDHFKWINDAYGHKTGDKILKVMKKASDASRKEEPIARVGGEEFAQILNESIEEDDVYSVFERHNTIMQEESVKILKDAKPLQQANPDQILREVKLSGGTTRSGNQIDGEKMDRLADEAQYESKANGRNMLTLAEYLPDGSVTFIELPRKKAA